ncbi:MAG: ribonuclease III [Planctomycetia bacterium]
MPTDLAECQRVIGYHFANPMLLEVALTHSSLRTPERECNERLEFLGDSVLGLVVTEELYRQLPDQAEGELTRLKSAIVSRGSLFRASQRLGLVSFADFARGVGRRDELPVSVTANLVESVIGAIYLDAGYFPAREFVLRHLGEELEAMLEDRGAKNYKSLLQHEVQEAMRLTPTYRTLEEGGPDHRKQFVVAAIIRGQEWGRAGGSTKKEAEQEAARLALEAFQRRGRGRRRAREEGEAGVLQGARDVGEHLDDDLTPPPRTEAGADLPPPALEDGEDEASPAPPAGWARATVPAAGGAGQARDPVPARAGRGAPPRAEGAPSPLRAAASSPGFSEGLEGGAPPRDAAAPPAAGGAHHLGSVEARRKAPAAWVAPPDDGFASGL